MLSGQPDHLETIGTTNLFTNTSLVKDAVYTNFNNFN